MCTNTHDERASMNLRSARDLGAAIRAARKERGWSQVELAEQASVSRRWLITLEQGKAGAELGLVLQVLDALGLQLALAPRPADAAPPESNRARLTLAQTLATMEPIDPVGPRVRSALAAIGRDRDVLTPAARDALRAASSVGIPPPTLAALANAQKAAASPEVQRLMRQMGTTSSEPRTPPDAAGGGDAP
jgi:HTH-type transcriptional regulator/antitoxin HipB